MAWFNAVVHLIDVLKWPLLIGVLAWVFRDTISDLLSNLAELGWGSAKAKFRRRADATLKAVEAGTAEQPPQQQIEVTSESKTATKPARAATVWRLDTLLATADTLPDIAIRQAWALVQTLGVRVAAMEGRVLDPADPSHFLDWSSGRFTGMNVPKQSLGSWLEVLNRMYMDIVVNDVKPDSRSARAYVHAAWRVASMFDQAIKDQTYLDSKGPLPTQVDGTLRG